MRVTVLPSTVAGWARYCINMGVSIQVYTAGYILIQSPEGPSLLASGFPSILDAAVKIPYGVFKHGPT